MKKFLLFALIIVALLFSFFPVLAASAYLFGGRQAFMEFITEIPDGRFWLVGIPMFISCFGATMYLINYIFIHGLSPEKPKKEIYYLQDDSSDPLELIDMDGNKVFVMNLGKKDQI